MKRPHSFRIALMLGTLLPFAAAAPRANAQAFFVSNATINYAITGDAVVGYGSFNDYLVSVNPASPTVSLVSGGSISGDLDVLNSSHVSVSGGSVAGNLFTYNNSVVSISGGSITGGLTAMDNSIINISGGSIGGNLIAENSSTLNFFGSLTDTLVNFGLPGYSEYALFGTLADGTTLNGRPLYVHDSTGAKFTLNPAAVPEPGSIALLAGIGTVGIGFLRRRKQASKAG